MTTYFPYLLIIYSPFAILKYWSKSGTFPDGYNVTNNLTIVSVIIAITRNADG